MGATAATKTKTATIFTTSTNNIGFDLKPGTYCAGNSLPGKKFVMF
jgi:hypothetical protein